jgi:transglutaminase-like putative cysteine protease
MKKIIVLFVFYKLIFAYELPLVVKQEILKGNFIRAKYLIDSIVCFSNLDAIAKWNLNFKKEKLDRISLDFNKKIDDILPYIKQYLPNIKEEEIKDFEKDKSLEMMFINGEKKYFYNADKNLFRVNKKLRDIKNNPFPNTTTGYKIDTYQAIPFLLSEFNKWNKRYLNPIKITLKYSVILKDGIVPEGEIVRGWFPFPKENQRQKNVKLLSCNADRFIIEDTKNPHRSIYFEKRVEKNKPLVFEYSISYLSFAEVNKIDFTKDIKYDFSNDTLLKEYVKESPPHIVFSDKIRELSNKIVGNETNKLKIVKKIYQWIDENIPWASAREYSTIDCIPEYVIGNMHGDCGQVSLLFITLCRLNGIPAKWQSGWMIHPNEINLHDWAEIYIPDYGWVPVDQSFGIHNFENEEQKFFFLGSLDNYHLTVNDDISRNFYPLKVYPRSETVDFQRGELEWRGGNIYFNNWKYNMEIKYGEK